MKRCEAVEQTPPAAYAQSDGRRSDKRGRRSASAWTIRHRQRTVAALAARPDAETVEGRTVGLYVQKRALSTGEADKRPSSFEERPRGM